MDLVEQSPPKASDRQRSYQSRRWAIAALLLIGIQVFALAYRLDVDNNDSVQYYVGACNLRAVGDPYALSATDLEISPTNWRYCYPPMLAFLWLPLTSVNVSVASTIWLAVNVLLTTVLARLLAGFLPGLPRAETTTLLLAFLLLYPPHGIGIALGQSHVLLAVLIVGAWCAAVDRREIVAGLLLGLAIAIKLFPALLLIAFYRSNWRRAVAVAVAVALLWGLATAWMHVAYVEQFVLQPFYPRAAAFNVSLAGMASRLFENSNYAVPVVNSPGLARGFTTVGGALVLSGLVWLWKCRSRQPLFAGCACAMLLLTPIAGFYHLNLLPAVALICWPIVETSPRRKVWLAVAGCAIVLTAIPPEYGVLESTMPWAKAVYQRIHSGWGVLLLAPQTYGLILMFAGALMLGRARHGGHDEEVR